MTRALRSTLLVVAFTILPVICAPAGIVSAPRVLFSRATMTASAANGDTALVVRITNASPHAITLLSITDPQASGSMFFRATTLIASTQPMRYVASIVVRAHQQLTLSYEHLGAMIAGLHQRLRAGSRVPLDIKWSDSASVHHDTFVYFRVVKGPAHLHFVMGG